MQERHTPSPNRKANEASRPEDSPYVEQLHEGRLESLLLGMEKGTPGPPKLQGRKGMLLLWLETELDERSLTDG